MLTIVPCAHVKMVLGSSREKAIDLCVDEIQRAWWNGLKSGFIKMMCAGKLCSPGKNLLSVLDPKPT